MKKLITLTVALLLLLSLSSLTYASTAVSQMATSNGGQSVAACAQAMDKGVSECAQMTECSDM